MDRLSEPAFTLSNRFLVCRFPFHPDLVQMPPGLPGRIVTFAATHEPHTGQAGGIVRRKTGTKTGSNQLALTSTN
jgi:hypothetical protein